MNEGGDNRASFSVDLSAGVDRRVSVFLNSSGTAEYGIDYEFERSVIFQPNQTRATIDIVAFDDWIAEESETFTVSFSSFSTAVSAGATASLDFTIVDDADVAITQEQKAGQADLWVDLTYEFDADWVYVSAYILNVGIIDTGPTRIRTYTVQYELGMDVGEPIEEFHEAIPAIEGDLGEFTTEFALDLSKYGPGKTYVISSSVDPPSEVEFRGDLPNTSDNAFTLDENGNVVATCQAPSRPTPTETTGDPLFEHQWPLQNTGQTAFAADSGLAGEDLHMRDTLAAGMPTGKGVKVAVVDTGLEICHPDLTSNVVSDGSFNFKADPNRGNKWFGSELTDPFLPSPSGDHGTSVAGIIATVADDGSGSRGVAPDAELVGYNFLSEQCCQADALGMSSSEPNSSQIDVFNMSYGPFPYQGNIGDDSVYKQGTSQLREGKGAIYVKAAGNSFGDCFNFRHQVHIHIGCSGANSAPSHNLPYLIVVGAVSANGDRSSYSSVGSNLWIAGMAGEYGSGLPATITTDQVGTYRGYDFYGQRGLSKESTLNPHGDFISTFNGTSAAAPHIAGVVALLLEVEPELTWRDVKHVLANTARVPRLSSSEEINVVIGGELATLQHDWVTNGAGYRFNNWFGFGIASVDAAIAMIRGGYGADSLGVQMTTEWLIQDTESQAIPDENGAGVVRTMNVGVGAGLNIEAVQLHVEATHLFPAELGIELTSPSGTRSILNSVFNNALMGDTQLDWNLLSNAFYGEDPSGDWTLRVIDVGPGDTGTMSSWALRFWLGDHPARN